MEQQSDHLIGQFPLFRDLTPPELDYVHQITVPRFVPKKSVIFTEGSERQAVYFIREGLVKTFKTDANGNEQIVSFLKSGEMFPHTGFFNNEPYPATATAVTDSHLFAVPISSFERMILQHPEMSVKMMRVMGAKIQELQTRIQELTGCDVEQRLFSILNHLAEKQIKANGNTRQIELPVTHQELASVIGTSRETVSRLLNQLRKEQILQISRNEIVIIDWPSLKSKYLKRNAANL
ncbi:Crp/Fnr family transcriptional regulator [Ferviditalea candida]|uniref:Crp/Fnr family transcriptional regulator n=1 Tax=Ferviditalea candida TaxID=3108399 RepID=A0ABU5ZJD8_9BACL|nr:Crp/Fnr family transcriptional regulator [Paenibacillaceae bacterium T2]